MTRLFVQARRREQRLALAVALVGFAAMFAFTLALDDPAEPGAVVYAPSVALVALEFGAGGGVAAGLLATVLYVAGIASEGDAPAAWEIVARLAPFVVVGLLVGGLGRRLRHSVADLAAAREARRQARELNDSVVQGLVLARYALDRGDAERAAGTLDATLAQARQMISDLIGAEPVEPGDLRRETPAGVD